METLEQILWFPLMTGFIFLVAGIITRAFPPKGINSLYGYRTPASMRSDDAWQFAQKFSDSRMIEGAVFLIILSPIGLLLDIGIDANMIIGVTMAIASAAYIFFTTERALAKKFPKK
jgi:uncharacterized membrane protein